MDRLERAKQLMKDINEGDTVLITKSFFNSFETYCDKEEDIPLHNHGIVIKVNTNHKHKNTGDLGFYSLVTFKMPNGELIELFSRDLIKLF